MTIHNLNTFTHARWPKSLMAVYSGICFLGAFHEKILTPVIKKVVIVW
jgi:hypothetical protein